MHAQRTVCTTQLSRSTSSLVSCLVRCLLRVLFHFVVDAVIGLTLSLIAHVVIVVFVVAILNRIFLYGRYTLYTSQVVLLHNVFLSFLTLRMNLRMNFCQNFFAPICQGSVDAELTGCSKQVLCHVFSDPSPKND